MGNNLRLTPERHIANKLRAPTEYHRTHELGHGRAHCGNPRCSHGWLAIVKDSRRPVFEGRWGCCGPCVGSLVDAATRRESENDEALPDQGGHRHRMPLGLILLSQGKITHPELQRALELQRRSKSGRIGDWLIKECGLTQGDITRALSVQWQCPVLTMEGFDPEAMALAVPRLLTETLGIVPLRIAGKQILYLAFVDQLDASAAFAMERMSGLSVQSGLADPAEWAGARQRLCACDGIDAKFESVVDMDSMSRSIKSTIVGIQPRASCLVRIHQFYWLRMWLETGAMTTRNGGVPATREDVSDRIYAVAPEQ